MGKYGVFVEVTSFYRLSPFGVCHDRNTDKMSDEEKLPIAIAGVAFITLPFIAGLIALYAAQGN